MNQVTPTPSAAEIFFGFIYEVRAQGRDEFNSNPVDINQVFYDAYRQFPEMMTKFQFIKRNNPYSNTLEEQIQWAIAAGVICPSNILANSPIKIIGADKLEEPSAEIKPVAQYLCDRL